MESSKRVPRPLDPKNPAYRWKLWVNLGSRPGENRHVFWRKIFYLLALLALAGWFCAVGAAWTLVKYHRGFSEVRYVDLAFPWRWGNYRATVAHQYKELGRSELRHGRPDSALSYLNASLAMAPSDMESRQLTGIAQYQMGFKTAALTTLRAGIKAGGIVPSEQYLDTFYDAAFALQADDVVIAVGRDLLPAKPEQTRIYRLVAFKEAMARYFRGNDAEAERIIADWRLHNIPEGEILFASCQAESGFPEQATIRLEKGLARFAKRHELYVALVQLADARGMPSEARRFALLQKFDEPELPMPRIELIRADHALGRKADERREIDLFCRDFGGNKRAAQMLAEIAAETGNVGAAERAREWAKGLGLPALVFDLWVAQAAIVAGDYSSALGSLALVQLQKTPMGRLGDATLAGFKSVALFGAKDGAAKLAFADLLPVTNFIRPIDALFLVQQLRRFGNGDQARQLLERACAANPDDEPLLAELIRTEVLANDRAGLIANLPRFLAMRKPPRDALQACLSLLTGKKDADLRAKVAEAFARSPVGVGLL